MAVDGSASLEILRCTQDDIKSERLPRSLCSLAMTAHSISLAMTAHSVILNEVKNLEVSVAVDGSASLEILRCTQDDIERDCHGLFQASQ